MTDKNKQNKIQQLYDYLKENQDYLVNYAQKKQTNQTYTSQVAESHIDSLINARHKKDRKMQWTREWAHQILQIRAMIASQEWENQWLENVLSALGVAA